ncbi:MAG TPA: HAD family hydrolase [Terriglobales bacterium]|nr:HAD family hydrolase [Terriglobales bacterium]
MTEISCRGLLFDLDGVLIDSTPAVSRVWHRWALEHGFDPEKVVMMAHGRPSRATIKDLLPNSDIEAEDREVERREIEDLEGVVPLAGALQLLQALPAERWTIATSGTRPLATVRLRAAGLPIPDSMITGSEVKIGKPDPEPYLKAAALLGFAAADCVVVEDTAAGVRSGRAAGARVIGFTTTMSAEELRDAGANWILHDCRDIRVQSVDGDLRLALGEQ